MLITLLKCKGNENFQKFITSMSTGNTSTSKSLSRERERERERERGIDQ